MHQTSAIDRQFAWVGMDLDYFSFSIAEMQTDKERRSQRPWRTMWKCYTDTEAYDETFKWQQKGSSKWYTKREKEQNQLKRVEFVHILVPRRVGLDYAQAMPRARNQSSRTLNKTLDWPVSFHWRNQRRLVATAPASHLESWCFLQHLQHLALVV